MALTEQEKVIVSGMKKDGYSMDEIKSNLIDYRNSAQKEEVLASTEDEVEVGTPETIYNNKQIKTEEEDISIGKKFQDFAGEQIFKVPKALDAFGKGMDQLIGGAISSTPKLIGNTAAGITGIAGKTLKYTPYGTVMEGLAPEKLRKAEDLLESLSNQFKEGGIEDQKSLQNFLNVDDESKMAAIGETFTEIAAIMSPTPLGKGNLVNRGRQVLTGLKNGNVTKKILGIITEGAALGAKAELVGEGEITREGLEEGALVNLGFAGVGAGIKKVVPQKTVDTIKDKIKEGMSSLMKVPTGKTSLKQISKEIDSGADAVAIIKQRNPSFKITDNDIALKETLEEAGKTKENIFNQYNNILEKNNVKVKGKELVDETMKILDDADFQTLVRNTARNQGEGNLALEILERKIKNADLDRSVLELYNDTKHLQTSLKGLFNQTSSKDALESVINLQVLKGYNNVIGKKIGELKGNQFSALKKEYGALKTFEDSIGTKYKRFLNKSSSGLHNYADAFLDSELITSAMRLDPLSFTKASITKVLRSEFNKLGDPNQILGKVFKNFDELAELESNPLKAQLKERFKQFGVDLTKTTTVSELIDND